MFSWEEHCEQGGVWRGGGLDEIAQKKRMVLYKQSTSYSTLHRPASSLKFSEEGKKDEPLRATMRKSYQLPLVPLLLLWAVCSVVQVQAEVKAVKLCGREFIRAVVYTCGGSRWRRLLTPQNDGELKFCLYPKTFNSSIMPYSLNT